MNRKEFQVFAGKMFDAALAMAPLNGGLADITQALTTALANAEPSARKLHTFEVPEHGMMPVLTTDEMFEAGGGRKLEAVKLYNIRNKEWLKSRGMGLLAAKHAVEKYMGVSY